MIAADVERKENWGILAGLPGHPMMWVLIFSELVAFGLCLGAFSVARVLNREIFASGQAALDPALAGLNTIVLVTSGWAAAKASSAARHRAVRRARGGLIAAIALGLAFVAIKLIEYAAELSAGASLEGNTFFTLYFLLTGFHLAHVGLGIVILALVAIRAEPDNVETGAAFWHMVDLVWVLMFPIIYLVR